MFYGLGSVVQHYWCNIYTRGSLANELSSNHIAITVGIVLWILGESINFYHHAILANLRPTATSSGYVIPSGGFFHYIVCPHYFGWVLCCCPSILVSKDWAAYTFFLSLLTLSQYITEWNSLPHQVTGMWALECYKKGLCNLLCILYRKHRLCVSYKTTHPAPSSLIKNQCSV